MKALLIEPPRVDKYGNLRILGSFGEYKAPFYWPPLDLTILSTILKKMGWKTQILDMNARNIKLSKLHEYVTIKPDICIFTSSITTLWHDASVAPIIKTFYPKCKTIIIGTAASQYAHELSDFKHIDIIIADPEPELAIIKFCKGEIKPKGKIIRTGKKLMNFDGIWPDHFAVRKQDYSDPFSSKPIAVTYTSRGCPWSKCIYCSCPAFFAPYRTRSIPDVKNELNWLAENDILNIRFFDAEFVWDAKRVMELCKAIPQNMKWIANARADRITKEIAETMAASGCISLNIGLESADPQILCNIKKGITTEDVKSAVAICKDAGIQTALYCIFGLPGETRETMLKTFEFVKEVDPDVATFGIAAPHRGTEFYNYLVTRNYLTYYNPECASPSKQPVYSYPTLSSKDIFEFSKHAYKSFYLNPKSILKRLAKVRSFSELKFNIKTALKLLR